MMQSKTFFRILFSACMISRLLTHCQPKPDIINIWYGSEQTFGIIGNAQRQINILGNIRVQQDSVQAWYTLNDDTMKNHLTLGCDLHRLALPGDFNIEIERELLSEGKNQVMLFVQSNSRIVDSEKITVSYSSTQQWPLPYHVHWDTVNRIQNVVEVVDGHWELTGDGIRTVQRYYDRILAFGDASWRNYEVQTSVIFHDYTPPADGPPTYNVTHVAIASRWPGHDFDDLQPNRKWFPLGATSEFRMTAEYDSCRWRIFDGEHFYEEQSAVAYRTIEPGVKYNLKHRVTDISENRSQYSVKCWRADSLEPTAWDFQAIEPAGARESGSACLIAHHTDVTFGDISVVPVHPDHTR